jgi:PAS domain S-box-containing protein
VQPQEPSYELVKALTHPDDTEYWERSVNEAIDENKEFRIDYRAVRPDGSVVWIHNEAEIVRDEHRNPLKMFGTAQDVTERKQAEQALRESEEKFRNLAEQSPNMIFINRGGRIAYANARCEEATGYTRDEFHSPDFDFLTVIAPESRDSIRESYRRHLEGEDVAPVEYAILTKTGRRIDAILTTKLIQYEGQDAILGTVTDITERKRAEEALKLHDLRLEALLQLNKMTEASGQDVLGFVREEIIKVTQSEFAFVGFISEDESVMSIDNWSKETMAQCAVVGTPMHFPVEKAGLWGEAIRQRKPVIVSDYDAPHPSKRGYPEGHVPVKRFLGIPVMMNDAWRLISRKKAEAALRESENKYRTLLKNIPQKIFYKDVGLAYVLCNDSFAEDLKIEPEEIRGKTDYNFFPKDLAEKYRADDKRILESGNAEEIEEEYLKDGKNIAVHTFKAPLKDEQGDTVGIFGIFWDITGRKHAEEALKRSEERYALAQQAASVGSWDWNIATGDLVWSEQIEPMFGFGQGEFGGTYEAFLECVHPDDRQYVVDSVNACVEAEQDYSIEHRIVWPDGSIRWLSEKGDVIRNGAGNAIRMLGVVQDITERKTAEERLLLGSSILEIINQKEKGQDIIRRILQLVKDLTGFDAVGIRLHEGDDYPYFEVNGFSEDFVSHENYLCARDESGQTVLDSQGQPILECMCGSVILGHADPAAPFFTQGGSFWTNSTTNLLASTSEKERLTHTRNHCNKAGYESVALIPLRSGAEIVGLLQLNDHRKGRFTTETIRFFERIGDSIGIALARMNAEEEIKSVGIPTPSCGSPKTARRFMPTLPGPHS